MSSHGERTRATLMDAAEELFAANGIDAVTNRQIAVHAGNANHSAVTYHFGGREELVRAMLERHMGSTRDRRRELVEQLPDDTDLRDLLGCFIVPWTDQLASLPRPSSRARFLQQLKTVPSMVDAMDILTDPLEAELIERVTAELADIPDQILAGRAWIMARMVTDVCAGYEAKALPDGAIRPTAIPGRAGFPDVNYPDWTGLARFLIDISAGMLAAPVTADRAFLGS